MLDLLERIPPWLYIAVVAHLIILGTVAYLIFLERKVAAWVQDRIGPNRVGPWGLLQSVADGIKMLVKEDYRPAGADRVLFTVAPAIMMILIIMSIAVIPWGGVKQTTRDIEVRGVIESGEADALAISRANTPGTPENARLLEAARRQIPLGASIVAVTYTGHTTAPHAEQATVTYRYHFQVARLNIGVLFIIMVLALAVYGVVVGGWASNNKYSFLGGLRATAQMISYEIPLALSLLTIVIMFGTLELDEIVSRQAGHYWLGFIPAWNVFTQPLAFILFLVCIHAEANRAPFDLAEAEQELVGGYHTEYSSMRFGLFFLAEYAGMMTTSAVCVALFFGGWHLPGLGGSADPADPAVTTSLGLILLRCAVYFAKVMLMIGLFMWVRWSLPRFRFDQLMVLAWRSLVPFSLALLLGTALVLYWLGPGNANFVKNKVLDGQMGAALLIMNVVLLAAALGLSRLLPAGPPTNRRVPATSN